MEETQVLVLEWRNAVKVLDDGRVTPANTITRASIALQEPLTPGQIQDLQKLKEEGQLMNFEVRET